MRSSITTLVDNVYDALLTDDQRTTRAPFRAGTARAPQFEGGIDDGRTDGRARLLRAGERAPGRHHDVAALRHRTVAGRHGHQRRPARRRPVRSSKRWCSATATSTTPAGWPGLAGKRGTRSLPMVVHPMIWTRRRLAVPGREPDELPTLSKRALEGEGFAVIERREPSLLVDGCVLITGEVDRTTEFEHGMPPAHQAWTGSEWRHDPLVVDDQALVVHVRDRGLVVLTGCGHAGAVNIVRHAQRLTAVPTLHALVGGLHLSGPAFEPDHRSHRRRADRDGSRARRARALHRLAGPACLGRGPARCLGRRQQRLVVPARRRLIPLFR